MANKQAQARWRARKKAGLIRGIRCNLCSKRLRGDSHHTLELRVFIWF